MSLSYGVITICLNAGKTIGDTVRSVLGQQPPPRQYVIVDGGSTDDTLTQVAAARAAVPAAASVDLRLEPQRQRPGSAAGIPAAWNQGLEHLDAEIVCIINADDWYEPETAATVLQAFADHPDADLVVAPIQYRNAPGSPVLRVQQPRSLRWLPALMPVPHPGCFVRRRVYERIGVFNEEFAVSADYEFIYRAARAGCRLHRLDRPLVSMRPGGFARQRLALARRETFRIGRAHSGGTLVPAAAFLLRWLTRR
jgi:glycosyltransferase involved in cell wall biosynthesis